MTITITSAKPDSQTASFAPYLRGLRARARRMAEAREAERRLTLEQAQRAAELLRERFGARQVIAFGSVLQPDRFDERSDIDLAVSGVAPARFFRAWAEAAEVVGRALDLVDLDDCGERLRQAIVAEGMPL